MCSTPLSTRTSTSALAPCIKHSYRRARDFDDPDYSKRDVRDERANRTNSRHVRPERTATYRSLTFVPVGPDTTNPPAASNTRRLSLFARAASGSTPAPRAREHVLASAIAPATFVGPS